MLRRPEPCDPPFAGELFLALADEGRLVLDARQADTMIIGLEDTLAVVRERLRLVRSRRHPAAPPVDELPNSAARAAVDAVFADLLAPGRLEEAAVELPKYIEALRRARRTGLADESS